MNISEVKAFLAIVSAKSISKAAEMLYLTQSTVSFQLKTLEKELDVMLIERNKGQRQINLTHKGQEFISIAERYVQVWNEAHSLQYKNTANLTINSVDSLNIYTFAPFYQQLLQGDPPIRLRVLTYQTPEIFKQIENHSADVGFVLSPRRYQNIIMKPLFQEKMLYVQMKGQRIKQDRMESIHSKNLDFRKEIFFNWGPEFSQWHSAWCNPNIHPILQVDTITMLMLFLKDDLWTILPAILVEVLKRKYQLICRPLEEGPPDRICYKLTHRFPKPAQLECIEIFEKKLERFLREECGL